MLTGLSQINLQIMWHRLISVVEEQAQTLLRTAFSSMVRECGDLSAGVFDMNGRMLAQAVTGTPGHVNSMAESVKHFLRYFPADTMKPGDIYITNDPWMGTGHLNDFVLTTPAFHKGRMVALFSCTSHLIDIGGIGFGPDATDVHMEGIYIPFLKLADQGEMNDTLLAMIRANTRQPVESEGDVYSLAACNDIGCQRLSEMMGEFELDDLVELGGYIEESSRAAGLTELAKLPNGVYQNTMRIDGYDAPLDLCATVTVSDTGIHVDFDGTSPESRYGINVPLSYTTAYTCFGLSCIVAPKVPNNAGSLGLMSVSAPSGCILNAQKPAAVSSRHVIGQLLPDVVFGCLRQAASERTPAEGTSCLYNINMRGRTLGANGAGAGYVVTAVTNGGTGARPTKDGLSATAYPSGVRASPIEILESIAPLVFWRKELRPDSGGAGRFRGGHGQYLEIENRDSQNFELLAAFDRIDNPPRGHDGGENGAKGRITLSSGTVLKGKGFQDIPAGQRLMVETPGGAGIGNPHERAPEAIVADIRDGLVTPDAAERDYAYAASKRSA
ncbi:MAG: hydantoinase B/oxoprolinase family protein [Alphaproteobacteria bacterium]|jgi:N-methylhydantoinase B|nr:hydantoinase B/oxoprolinase family protein [Alphaproteobacteria bacterium]